MTEEERGLLLRTLGHPVLTGPTGDPSGNLRRKDLALLAYLCVEGPRPHSRARLAALLWGESRECKARGSLTQALHRLKKAAGKDAVTSDRESVRFTGTVACDAVWLLAGDERLDALLSLYDGPFLEGFEAGFGSQDFTEWADARRAELRNAAVRWLERTGSAAEAAGDWALALRIGERGTQIDPVHEEARRRVLRALLALGERNQALRYYEEFAGELAELVGGEPDPETHALYELAIAAVPEGERPPARAAGEHGFLLRTLGHPVLIQPVDRLVGGLRRKDLALLAYLCVEGPRPHSRARLAALLWGESPERKARHSLTQALGRIERATVKGALVVDRESVRPTGMVVCDAVWLLAGDERLDPLLTLYEGPFLEGFEAGFGSQDFSEWACRQHSVLRKAALRWLDQAGAEAEAEGDWPLALRIGERSTQIDPVHEEARRRVLRALLETGEANLALRYYQEFADYLAAEVGGEPDAKTRDLLERIRAAIAASPPPPPGFTPAPVEVPATPPAGSTAQPPAAETPAVRESVADDPPPAAPPAASPTAPRAAEGWLSVLGWLSAGALTVVLLQVLVAALFGSPREHAALLPGHGESIRAQQGGPAYLAYAETLWRYPDPATLARCLGGWGARIRPVRRLPDWPRRVLPSVATHRWLGDTVPVGTAHPHPTQYVAVGCVLAPAPDPPTLRAIFGHTQRSPSHPPADSVLPATPRTKEAGPFPVRAAGTLIRDAGGGVKWIVYHGGALTATAPVLATYCRSPAEAVPVSAAEYRYYRASAELPPADPPCRDTRHPPCPATATAIARRGADTQTSRGDAPLCASTAPRESSSSK